MDRYDWVLDLVNNYCTCLLDLHVASIALILSFIHMQIDEFYEVFNVRHLRSVKNSGLLVVMQ